MIPRTLHPARPAPSAFSLVELLVVVAIVALLSALFFPAFRKARLMAWQASCASNLRSIGAGLFAFGADTGTLPDADSSSGTWDKLLVESNYLNKRVLRCPADQIVRDPTYSSLAPRSYSANAYILYTQSQSNLDSVKGNLRAVQRPLSQVVLLFDRPSSGNFYSKNWGIAFGAPYAVPLPVGPNPNACHITGANYLFCDGHVDYLDFMKTRSSGSVSEQSAAFGQDYFLIR